jgi:hypothetical protein
MRHRHGRIFGIMANQFLYINLLNYAYEFLQHVVRHYAQLWLCYIFLHILQRLQDRHVAWINQCNLQGTKQLYIRKEGNAANIQHYLSPYQHE